MAPHSSPTLPNPPQNREGQDFDIPENGEDWGGWGGIFLFAGCGARMCFESEIYKNLKKAPHPPQERGRAMTQTPDLTGTNKTGINDIGPKERRDRVAHVVVAERAAEDGRVVRYLAEERIAALAARGSLNVDQAWAAERLRGMFWEEARSISVGSAGIVMKVQGGGAARGGVEERVDAVRELYRIRDRVLAEADGAVMWAVIHAVCGQGLTIAEHVGGRGRRAAASTDALRAGLDLAADLFRRNRRSAER